MSDSSTRPAPISDEEGASQAPWQTLEEQWSFGPTEPQLIGAIDAEHLGQGLPHSRNEVGMSTMGPQEISESKVRPLVLQPRDFGKRALEAISQWEGVVESVKGTAFLARLIPFKDGRALPEKLEFAKFELDELANESDAALVQEGAIFYWTLGRERNAAGTVANVSLLRFRRLPAPGPYQERKARAEAEELLRVLEVQPSD